MKFTNDYQLKYEGVNTRGVVAERNIRDYFIILSHLPQSLRKVAHQINQDELVFGMLRAHDYSYDSNYMFAVDKINAVLAQHRKELQTHKGLLTCVRTDLTIDRDKNRRVHSNTPFDAFRKSISHLFSQNRAQDAIHLMINRYGLDNVDRELAKRHIRRNDRLVYTYRGMHDDEISYHLNYMDVEETIFQGEYKSFAPLASLDVPNQLQNDTERSIISLWSDGSSEDAISKLATTFGSYFEDVLDDFQYIESDNLSDIIREDIEKQSTHASGSDLMKLAKVLERVETMSTALWDVSEGISNARPLSERGLLDMIWELEDRVAE